MACFAGLGALAAWLAFAGPRPAPEAPGVPATLAGRTVCPPATPRQPSSSPARPSGAWLGQSVTVVVAGVRTERTREQLGARIDWPHLRALLAELRDGESALRRAPRAPRPPRADRASGSVRRRLRRGDGAAPADQGRGRPRSGRRALRLQDEGRVARRARTAHGRVGHARAARRRASSGAPRPSRPSFEPATARRTAAALAGASTDKVLGWFETQYSSDAKHVARAFNLHVAASKLDGFVLMPGDVFDFNQAVGPRSEENGYKVAPVIAQGALVDGMGGGTCQVAGTLHAASLFAGLDIVERRPHTRPSFYIKMGLDAAVAYPAVTLRLGNPYPFPVVLHESVQGGVVRAEVLGPSRPREVTFLRRIDEVAALPRAGHCRRVVAQGHARAQAAGHPRLQDHPVARPPRRDILGARAPDRLLPPDPAALEGRQGARTIRSSRRTTTSTPNTSPTSFWR